MLTYFLVGLIAFVGAAVQSTAGIGYAMFCMALWPMLIPLRTASIVEVISAFFMVLYIAIRLFRYIRPRLLVWPLLSTALLNPLGVSVLINSPEEVLRRVLGVVLLAIALYFTFFSDRLRFKATPVTGLLAGAVSGLMGGIFSIAGPPMAIYFLGVVESKEEYNATLQCYFCISTLYVLMVHILMGNFSGQVPLYSAAAIAGLVPGTAAGMLLFRKLSIGKLRRLIYVFLMFMGIYLIIKG